VRTFLAVIGALAAMIGCSAPKTGAATAGGTQTPVPAVVPSEAVTLKASDAQPIFGDLYRAPTPNSKAVVLMFHQAGSNAGEYATIAPAITKIGFDCLAIDQRSGGAMWGRNNRTAEQVKGKTDYLTAYNDLLGALQWAKDQHYKEIIAWGSSYSASLVFRLAAEHPELAAILVFSPGEYFDEKAIVSKWASKVSQPVYFACTPEELRNGRQQIYEAIPTPDNDKLDAFAGAVHGSSTLINDKAPGAAGLYLSRVQAFLTPFARKAASS
jgi:dienelactone hydrolase